MKTKVKLPKLPALTKPAKPSRKLATTPNGKMRRGFNAISKEKQRLIASMGGKAISRNRSHMQRLGRKGGQNSHKGTSLRNRARKEA